MADKNFSNVFFIISLYCLTNAHVVKQQCNRFIGQTALKVSRLQQIATQQF